jgi:hypothetical protein
MFKKRKGTYKSVMIKPETFTSTPFNEKLTIYVSIPNQNTRFRLVE